MPKTISKKDKKQNISINTGEPIEEKELDLGPGPAIAVDDSIGGKEEDDDDLALDEEEMDPFGDKWEQ